MVQAYSRLEFVLGEQKLTVTELRRRMRKRGVDVNLKSLYRLSRQDAPLQRLDLRVAGAICEVCRIPLSDLISFEAPESPLRQLTARKQKRLDALMNKNSEGTLSASERTELQRMVSEAEGIMLYNARALNLQRRRMIAK